MSKRLDLCARAAALVVCVWVTGAILAPSVLAHPLGNFTVNHYARIEVSGDALAVRYVLDMAEIPSVQETHAADTNGDGVVSQTEWDAYRERKAVELSQQVDLNVDDQRLALEPVDVSVSQPLGQGDIPLVRLEMWLRPVVSLAPNVQHKATFRDRTDPARVGWREIVVHAGAGANVGDSDVPTQDVSDELRSYPDDLLQNPLDRSEAHWTFSLDGRTSSTDTQSAARRVNRPSDPLAGLVTATDLSPTVFLLALLSAAALGGIHAASPGHGKSIMAAYLVGTRGSFMHAAALALSVTASHTAGVLLLGILTVLASNLIVPDRLYPWLTLVSGAVVLLVGARFLMAALHRQTGGEHGHGQPHAHGANLHVHARGAPIGPTWRGLFALGLAGGIIPSGSALVVLLSSIALGRLGFGLVLIVAFGLGMAVVLVATGVLLVHAGRVMVRVFPESRREQWSRLVPVVSAAVMTLLGLVATVEGLSQTGLVGS